MFWADRILQNREGKEWVNDAWTPSGIIHMGGLKGPVIHDVLYKILKEKGKDVKFTFGFDDFDPIDGLPQDLAESHRKYLGVPIFIAPAPNGKGTFGEYYGNKMRGLFKHLDIKAEIYLASEYYKQGIYNKAITFVLDNTERIRKVYEQMYKKPVRDNWYPLQVVCPSCGKLGTTRVTGWDGKEVSFKCEESFVAWAKGCDTQGKVSPYDGNAKMPWKVEWAAKWWTFGVTIEAAGKDHASAGGSYDIARKICKDVFKTEPPLKLPYEFFLLGGKKMSSSKGLGLTGEELLEILTPQIARFLMIKTRPEQAVEFDPRSPDIIPRLYDDYQQAEAGRDDFHRAFLLSQFGGVEKIPTLRFFSLSQWVQAPNMEEEIKKEGLEYWATYARTWIEKYAPEKLRFAVQESLPEQAKTLTQKQREFLNKKLLLEIDSTESVDDYQRKIYDWAKELDLSSSEAFEAIYKALLGKNHGPKAAWLIFKHKDLARKRFSEISS